MIFKKMKGKHYLLLKPDHESLAYLKDYQKNESKANKKIANGYLNKAISLHIRSLYFMNYAKILQKKGKISKKLIPPVLEKLDKILNNYNQIVMSYIVKFKKLERKR